MKELRILKDKALLEHFSKMMSVTPDVFNENKHHYNETNKGFLMFTTGSNVVFKGYKKIIDYCKSRCDNEISGEIMDGSILFDIEKKLREDGYELEGHHLVFEYIQDVSLELPEGYTTKVIPQSEIGEYHKYKEFDNAFSFNKEQDVLAVAAFHNSKVVAMAACDNRVESSWQIGIDTLPEYRGKGLATYLVSNLAKEIVKHGKTPFYTTWGANIGSLKVAINSGFAPAASYYYTKKVKK